MVWGSETGIFSFADFLENLDRLNTSRFALHIRRKARGYFYYTETLLILPKSKTHNLLQSLLYPLVYTLKIVIRLRWKWEWGDHTFSKNTMFLRSSKWLGQDRDGRDSRYFSSFFQPKSEARARRVKLLARPSWGHPLSVPAALLWA